MTDELIITMRHARAAGICAPGVRGFMERHGLDLKVFVQTGYPESVIVATGEPPAMRVVEAARKEAGRG